MKKNKLPLFGYIILLSLVAACGSSNAEESTADNAGMDSATANTLQVTSPDFAEGEPIPAIYSCDGENINPEINWGAPPAGTVSLALIMDDPDAPSGDFVHWVVYNITPELRGMPEDFAMGGDFLPEGARQGRNGAGGNKYVGPCPPSGIHRYFFTVYALDMLIEAEDGLSKQELLDRMEGHILGQGQLMGTFEH